MPAIHATIIDPSASTRVKSLRTSLLDFDEQALVERLIMTLDPFKTATTQMSSETKPTLHYVLPWLLHLQNCLQLPSDTNAEKKFKKAMTDNLSKRPFDLPAYKMASFLHPETKQLRFLTEDQRKFTIDTAMEEAFTLSQGPGLLRIKQEPQENQQADPDAEPSLPQLPEAMPAVPALPNLDVPEPEPEPETEEPEAKKSKNEDQSAIDDLICMGVEKIDPRTKIRQELERYDLEPPARGAALQWWRQRVSTFPNLSRMARKYLCIPASSVPSERIFSLAGNIVTKKRCSLTSANVNQLIFLNKNRRIPDEVVEEESSSDEEKDD